MKAACKPKRNVTASVPCTCGELFQGSLEGEPCLVSCPIAIYSQASVAAHPAAGWKAAQALESLRGEWEAIPPVRVRRPLPVGRGYGTSTADITAALAAASAWRGALLSAGQMAEIAARVEPTDSTPFPGLTLFAHRNAAFHQTLGPAPALRVLIADPGGFIDSQAFNRQAWGQVLRRQAAAYREAFTLLRGGIEKADGELIGQAASLSAQLHQRILCNPLLEKAFALNRQIGALGVCRAHSGTIFGFLLQEEREDEAELKDFCQRRFPSRLNWIHTRLAGGGARISTGAETFAQEYAA